MTHRTALRLIGYWDPPRYPDPTALIDPAQDDDLELVADYLSRGFVVRSFMGYAPCRICGADNGTLELTDGVYAWPSGLAHYVRDHRVRLPDAVIAHILSAIDAAESADIDDSWWTEWSAESERERRSDGP